MGLVVDVELEAVVLVVVVAVFERRLSGNKMVVVN